MKKSIFVLAIFLFLSVACFPVQQTFAVTDKNHLKLWVDSSGQGNNTISFTISGPETVNVYPADYNKKILLSSETLDPHAWSDNEAVWYIGIRARNAYLQGKNGNIGISNLMWSVNGSVYKPLSTAWQSVITHTGRQKDLFEDEIAYQLNLMNENNIVAGDYKVTVEFEIGSIPVEQWP